MKHIFALLALLILSATSRADAPPKELEALNHYLGSWVNTISDNPKAKSTGSAQWTLDGRFLQQTWTLDADPGVRPTLSCTTMMTYDTTKGVYRAWQFFSTGYSVNGDGVWDAATSTFTWTIKDPNTGKTTVTKVSFPQEGVENWSFTTTNSEGKELLTMSGKNALQKAK